MNLKENIQKLNKKNTEIQKDKDYLNDLITKMKKHNQSLQQKIMIEVNFME